MAKFIKVHITNWPRIARNSDIWINAEKIIAIHKWEDEKATTIFLQTNKKDDDQLYVKQTPEEIFALLKD